MGRPRSNVGHSFLISSDEVSEMEAVLQAHNLQVPSNEILTALAEKFRYDVEEFVSYRDVESGDPEVLVSFDGLGLEVEEWINVLKDVRERSIPCESRECEIISPEDLIIFFKERKEKALYYDAHILSTERRRHDVRGCRCRFLGKYDHDQSQEIVQLRKTCCRGVKK